ncbi:MAG: hypothetical protein U5L96_07925 [Owenweeksia sp.]|nr:hypothetical protein [Owenweeksia sp.]
MAYNLNLNTQKISVAREIAEILRESGKLFHDETGVQKRIYGRLKSVKGLGWYIDDFKRAQVSYNLTDIDQNGMLEVFEATCLEAEKLGYRVTGSELVGLAPFRSF